MSEARAIAEINDQLRPGERLVMTSRTAEYREATHPATGPEVTLAAAAIELCPLDTSDVVTYLRQSAGGPRSAIRWDPVFSALPQSQVLAQVLSNPLMVGLARTIYNPRPGEHTGALPNPAELCSFSSRESIEGHLLDAFIPAVYRPARGRAPIRRQRNARLAEKWLISLAYHLQCIIREPGFAWWDIDTASPAMTYAMSGSIAGLAVGIPIALIPLLLVVTSLIRVRLAASGYNADFISAFIFVFRQYWEQILEIALFCGLVGGGASLFAAIGPRKSGGDKPLVGPWDGRDGIVGRILLGLLYGITYSLILYVTVKHTVGWPGDLYKIRTLMIVGLVAGLGATNERFRVATVAVIVVGAMVGAPFFLYKGFPAAGYAAGPLAGLAAGLAVIARGESGHYPSRSIRWNPRKGSIGGVVAAAAATAVTEFATGQTTVALIFGVAVGLGTTVIAGLERVPGDLEIAASPTLVLKRDRFTTLELSLVTAVAAGIAVGVGTFLATPRELLPDISPVLDGIIFGLSIGSAVGFAFGFVLSGYGSAWPQLVFARQILAIRRQTPQRLITFLSDAHRRGVLRQAGPIYEFRHIELQRRLASQTTGNAPPTWLQQVVVSTRWQHRQTGIVLRPFTPLADKRERGRRRSFWVTATVAAFAVVTIFVFVLDPELISRTGAAGRQPSTLVPVVACPTRYGIESVHPAPSPATKSAPVLPELGNMLAYYTDMGRSLQPILGPRGWICSAGLGADGGWGITIYPKGGSANGPIGIDAGGSSCIGCVYSTVCPLIPHAAAEIHFSDSRCSAVHPRRQVVTWIAGSPNFSASGNDVVSIIDPPGVKGYVTRSGGRYYARGILLYSWGQPVPYFGYPGVSGGGGARTINCTLPNAYAKLCTAILAAFRQQARS